MESQSLGVWPVIGANKLHVRLPALKDWSRTSCSSIARMTVYVRMEVLVGGVALSALVAGTADGPVPKGRIGHSQQGFHHRSSVPCRVIVASTLLRSGECRGTAL